MSRIQDILNKAEREGNTRRTRSLTDTGNAPAPVAAPAPRMHIQPVYEAPAPAAAPWTAGATAPAIELPASQVVTATLDPRLVTAVAPQSLAAEQYRLLRTRVKRAEAGRTMRAIIVTSPSKGDGKSLTSANLALAMAQEYHQRVLLIDCDLRRPTVSRLFAVPEGPGLSEILMGAADLESCLINVEDHRLTILPAGAPTAQPAELLGSAAMRRVLDTLRTRFDRILIDMPPVAPLADVAVLSTIADGVLMIVRAGVTEKPSIERALSGLDMTKVLGLVLNEAGEAQAHKHTYEGYGYVGG